MLSMKKYILFAFLFVGAVWTTLDAQTRLVGERAIYSQGYISPVLINPGAIGMGEDQHLLLNYRNAWASFPGSPKTFTFSYDGNVGNRLGIGAQLLGDSYGSFQTTKGILGLSYSINTESNKVGFGLTAEYVQHRLSGGLNLVNPNDSEVINRLDGSQYFDATLGIYGIYNNQLIYGLTLPSLISSRVNQSTSGATTAAESEIGFIAQVGYRLTSKEYDAVFEPSIIVKQVMLTPFHVDLNMKMSFLEERLTGGVTYTVGADKRIGFLLGAMISNFGFDYSYNVSLHEFQQYNNGSHEITLKLNLSPRNQQK